MSGSGSNISIFSLVSDALDRGPCDTPEQRLAIYRALEVRVLETAGDEAKATKAIDELRRTIARLDVAYGYFDDLSALGSPPSGSRTEDRIVQAEKSKVPMIKRVGKRRFPVLGALFGRGSGVSGTPPGPAPGEDNGPFSDHVYLSIDAELDGEEVICRYAYCYDPACQLQLSIVSGSNRLLFDFSTRAFSMRYAFKHLSQALDAKGLRVPSAGLQAGAVWETEERDCEEVRLPPSRERLHACAFISAPG